MMHTYYSKHGLRVVGVHRPRYDFARNLVLLADAVRRLEIEYPVVNDVDADVAHAYGAKALDTMFLINDDNLIVGRKSGRKAGETMSPTVCKALTVNAPALVCAPSLSSIPGENANSDAEEQSLYVHHNPNHPRAGQHCQPATPDVYVGEARSSDLDVAHILKSPIHRSSTRKIALGHSPQNFVSGQDFGAWIADEAPELWRPAPAPKLLGHVGCATRRCRVRAQVPNPMCFLASLPTHCVPCPHTAFAPVPEFRLADAVSEASRVMVRAYVSRQSTWAKPYLHTLNWACQCAALPEYLCKHARVRARVFARRTILAQGYWPGSAPTMTVCVWKTAECVAYVACAFTQR